MTRFAKYEGLGNDFIVVDVASAADFDVSRVPSLCDRRFGVGADGVLLVLPPADTNAAARMQVINADGSVPEMCGNGLRCVALHVATARGVDRGHLLIETDCGTRACDVHRGGDDAIVEIDMGAVRVLEKRRLEVDGRVIDVALVDAGNPHAIVLRSDPPADLDVLGPLLTRHPSFPNGTNVETMALKKEGIDVQVWERGVGRTLACGTGACAVVAEACREGVVRSGDDVRVNLPGGQLVVTHDSETGSTKLRGPARLVYRGELTR